MTIIKDKMMEIDSTGMTTEEFGNIVNMDTPTRRKFVGTPIGEFNTKVAIAVNISGKRWYSELSTELQVSMAIVLVILERSSNYNDSALKDDSSLEDAIALIDRCTFSKMDIIINSIIQGN